MTVTRVPVTRAVLEWAVDRSGRDAEVRRRFPDLPAWECGTKEPTLRQLQDFAAATRTPFGYLLLDVPPEEHLPIADLRTVGDTAPRPSADLLDTVYLCQRRQDWYRDYAVAQGHEPLEFVGSVSVADPPIFVAAAIRERADFGMERRSYRTWSDAVLGLAEGLERIGILVMISGIVGSNTHRPLDPTDFRGLTLADPLAPVIFVNGADSKSAQSFTLAHEAAHVWLGGSAVSRSEIDEDPGLAIERWCNAVAAELLVPLDDLKQAFRPGIEVCSQLEGLARRYKVSSLVVLRRLLDAGLLLREEFRAAYAAERDRVTGAAIGDSGGDFYRTTPVRTSRRFLEAVIRDTVAGRTLYREAFRLLGFQSQTAFDTFASRQGL